MMFSKPTYREYERLRMGDSENQLKVIDTMLYRSFGSSTFAGFWRYWNPLFSYYLLYYCYKPFAKFLPRYFAVVCTFAVSGIIHDFFASLLIFRFYIFFFPLFAFWGLLVIVENALKLNLAWANYWIRVLMHATIIIGTVFLGLKIRTILI